MQFATLNQRGVAAEILVPRTTFRTGEIFDASVEITSREDSTQGVTFVQTVLKSADSKILKVTPLELPAPFDLTALDWRRKFTTQVLATNEGAAELSVTISVESTNGITEVTKRLPLKVGPAGDLSIKRKKEPVDAFAGNDLYQVHPDGRQTSFGTIAQRDTNIFNIRVQNDSSKPASFVLRSFAPDADEWQLKFRHGEDDISASVFSPGGWTTPQMAPGASVDLDLVVHDIAGTDGDHITITTFLSNLDDSDTIDAVTASSTLAAVPVEIEMRRVTASGYATASIEAGKTDVDAPLEVVAAKATLLDQPVIVGGWVADGVTPMLLRLSAAEVDLTPFPEGRKFRLDLKIEGSGNSVEGEPLTNRLKLLVNSAWIANSEFELSSEAPEIFARFSPVAADKLKLADTELTIRLEVVDVVCQRNDQ